MSFFTGGGKKGDVARKPLTSSQPGFRPPVDSYEALFTGRPDVSHPYRPPPMVTPKSTKSSLISGKMK